MHVARREKRLRPLDRDARGRRGPRQAPATERPSVVREHYAGLHSPSRVGPVRDGHRAVLRERPIPAVVRACVVDRVIEPVPRSSFPPWVAPLQLHVRQEDQVVEEVVVEQAEAVDVGPPSYCSYRSVTVVSSCTPVMAGRWSVSSRRFPSASYVSDIVLSTTKPPSTRRSRSRPVNFYPSSGAGHDDRARSTTRVPSWPAATGEAAASATTSVAAPPAAGSGTRRATWRAQRVTRSNVGIRTTLHASGPRLLNDPATTFRTILAGVGSSLDGRACAAESRRTPLFGCPAPPLRPATPPCRCTRRPCSRVSGTAQARSPSASSSPAEQLTHRATCGQRPSTDTPRPSGGW